jgi:hypothetical protein
VHHEGSKITGRMSDFTVYHGHRNRIWAWAKNAPPLLFWGLLPIHLLLDAVLLLSFARQGKAGPYLRGVWDGLKQLGIFRREMASQGPVSTGRLARALVWSPMALKRKRGKIGGLSRSNSPDRR